MKLIETNRAPLPLGHYAQAVVHAGTIHVAGQLPIDPTSGEVVGPAAAEQAGQVLENIGAILREAGADLGDVLALTFYVTDLASWSDIDAVAALKFGNHRPARSVIGVAAIRKDCLVQASAIARVPGNVNG